MLAPRVTCVVWSSFNSNSSGCFACFLSRCKHSPHDTLAIKRERAEHTTFPRLCRWRHHARARQLRRLGPRLLLEQHPEQRFASAHEFERALEEVLLSLGKPVGPRQLADWVARQHAVAEAIKQSQTNEQTVVDSNHDSSEVPSLPQMAATESNVDLDVATRAEPLFDGEELDATKIRSLK